MQIKIKINDDGVPVLAQAREAIASIESAGSGGYAAIGPKTKSGDRAYGRYQVMGANIPSWTKQALGREMTPQEFLASPEAQDAVFNKIFGGNIEKYGADDAASIWFTGKPLAQGAGRRDILGTSGEQYVNKFNAAMGGEGFTADYTPGKFGLPTPDSPVTDVGDVVRGNFGLPRTPAERPGSLGEGGGGGFSPQGFGSKWRDPNYAAQQFNVPVENIKPIPPRSASVSQITEGKTPPQRAATETIAGKKPTSSTTWLYSMEANKLGLPNRIAKAVRENPALKPSLKEWVKTIEESPKSTSPEQMLQTMRQLSDLLKEFGF